MKKLSRTARLFILSTILSGIVLFGWFSPQSEASWVWLLGLGGLASLAQVLKVEGSTHESSYNTSWLIYGFTLVLLGGPATLLIIVISHLVEWVRYKYPWYIQLFNIANFIVATVFAYWVQQLLLPLTQGSLIGAALVVISSLGIFTLANHFLVGMVLKLARGQSLRESGVFGQMTLLIDFSLLALGGVSAYVWQVNPFLIPLGLIPLYLIYNTLKIPALQRQTEIDPKTGLFNAKHFAQVMERELARAEAYDRPLSLIMGDLDLLRNINNTYGHLAGDVVLIGVAKILKEFARSHDIVARFGGEEFSILMPETTAEQVYPLVEEMRAAIEAAQFEVSTSVTPIQATISFGIAHREEPGQTISDLIHNADLALYHSKRSGRNLTSINSISSYQGFLYSEDEFPEKLGQEELQARLDHATTRFRPNPVRQPRAEQPLPTPLPKSEPEPEPKQRVALPQKLIARPKPDWVINGYVALVTLLAVGFYALVQTGWVYPINWMALVGLTIVVILTEALAIGIYVRNTSISTSGAFLLAGVLLFGPMAGLVLSISLALTAKIIHRSGINRFIFNAANHLLYSSIIAGLVLNAGGPLSALPVFLNLSLSILAGYLAFISNTLLVSIVIGMSNGVASREIWRSEFRWLLPYYAAYGVVAYGVILGYAAIGMMGIFVVLVPLILMRISQVQYVDSTKENVTQLRSKNIELEKQALEITDLNEDLLNTLAEIVDMRDPYTYGHSKQVRMYVDKIGQEMGLDQSQMNLLSKAGLLHDIGKLGIPEQILFKPERLTHEEYDIVKKHPALGEQIIGKVHSFQKLKPIVRHHHERYDGLGYPDGLAKDQIPMESRIIALADAIEAMASDRPYREALGHQEILAEIGRNTGTQFDPEVVKAFFSVLEKEGDSFILNTAASIELAGVAPVNALFSRAFSEIPKNKTHL